MVADALQRAWVAQACEEVPVGFVRQPHGRIESYDLPEHASTNYKLGEISLIGGGSAGSKETEGASNYFNLLEFSPAGLDVLMYRARAKGSQGHPRSEVPDRAVLHRLPASRRSDVHLGQDWRHLHEQQRGYPVDPR